MPTHAALLRSVLRR